MTWTVPRTWVTGEIVTASEMNTDIRDNTGELKDTVQGDGGGTLEHRHKDGIWVNRGAAGNAGRIYYCTDTGWTIMDDGTLWHVIAHNPKLSDRLTQDFHEPGNASLAANGWIFGWRFTEVVSAECTHGTGLDHSYARLTAKTTSGAVGMLTPLGGGETYIETNASRCYPLICEMAVRLNESADVTYHFGLMTAPGETATPSPTSSIMFRYGSAGDADPLQFFTITRNNNGETKNDSATTPTHSNIDICRVEVDSISAARFYVNGALVATHAAGIPASELLAPGFIIRTNANADKAFHVDYIDLHYKRYLP